MSKQKNPYVALRDECRQWVSNVKYPRKLHLFLYDKKRLHEGFRLDDLAERVQAANTLGWDVILEVEEGGLYARYRKRPDEAPWAVR